MQDVRTKMNYSDYMYDENYIHDKEEAQSEIDGEAKMLMDRDMEKDSHNKKGCTNSKD